MQYTLAILLALATGLISAQIQPSSPACISTTSSSIICSSSLPSSTSTPCTTTTTTKKKHTTTTKATSKKPCASITRMTRPKTTKSPRPTTSTKKSCKKLYSDCRTKPDANQAFCASQYAACLGYNPFTSNGAGTATTSYGDNVYTTKVVTEYTTYCPSPTTVTYQNRTYTVTAPTTLTITNCPCTITSPVNSPAIASTKPPKKSATPSMDIPTSLAPIYSSRNPPNNAPSAQPDSPVAIPPANVPTYPPNNAPTQTAVGPTSVKPIATYTGAAAKSHVDHALVLAAVGWLALQ